MKLKSADELIGMDILEGQVVASLSHLLETEGDPDLDELIQEEAVLEGIGPWVLVITASGYGKRVPVSHFRLQKRAGQGLKATKFKLHTSDQMVGLKIVNEEDELMIITSRGIIIRQTVKAIPSQSRTATGVRLQRLDEDDAIAAIALVPPIIQDTPDNEILLPPQ